MQPLLHVAVIAALVASVNLGCASHKPSPPLVPINQSRNDPRLPPDPDHAARGRQLRNLHVFLRENGIFSISVIRGMGSTINVRSDQITAVRRLIETAVAENPERWNRFEFYFDNHPARTPKR